MSVGGDLELWLACSARARSNYHPSSGAVQTIYTLVLFYGSAIFVILREKLTSGIHLCKKVHRELGSSPLNFSKWAMARVLLYCVFYPLYFNSTILVFLCPIAAAVVAVHRFYSLRTSVHTQNNHLQDVEGSPRSFGQIFPLVLLILPILQGVTAC